MQQVLEAMEEQGICWETKKRHYAAWRVDENGQRTQVVYMPKTPGSDHSVKNTIGKLRRSLGFRWRGH